jgi:hypothetical protein
MEFYMHKLFSSHTKKRSCAGDISEKGEIVSANVQT